MMKSIYVSDNDRALWEEAQALCRRNGGSLSGILTQFLNTWVRTRGQVHPAIVAAEKSPENTIEKMRTLLSDLEQQLAKEEPA